MVEEDAKNSGFYKLRFFITPEELKRVVELLEPTQVRYYLTNYTHTEHDQNQVVEMYRAFYQYYTAAEKESGVRPFLHLFDVGSAGYGELWFFCEK